MNKKSIKPVVIDPEELRKKIEAEQERNRLEKERRKKVFDAICDLIDPVDEKLLLDRLNLLDASSWNEVIEERFLGRICGFPLCSNSIVIDFSRKYVIDKRRKMIYATESELNKFCSNRCLGLSRGILPQLYSQPLWITGDRPRKDFRIPDNEEEFLPEVSPSNTPGDVVKLKKANDGDHATAQLVRHIEELKIADHVESDVEDGPMENATENSEDEKEEKEFLSWLKSATKEKI